MADSDDFEVAVTVQVADVPAPSVSVDPLADPDPLDDDRVPGLVAGDLYGVADRGTGQRRGARRRAGSSLAEGVAQPVEHRLVRRVELTVGRLLVAQRGQLAEQLLLPVVEPGGGLDDDP